MFKFLSRMLRLALPGILISSICLTGCTTPGPMTTPNETSLSSRVSVGTVSDVTLQAALLDRQQASGLLRTELAGSDILPVLFVVNNRSQSVCRVRRDHFSVRIRDSRIEPALPGRAASLLRNTSGTQGAALAGFALFGIFAAPSIAAAEKSEAAAVEANRSIIFSDADLPAGEKIVGYLFFESPVILKKLETVDMEFCLPEATDGCIRVALINPYSRHFETP